MFGLVANVYMYMYDVDLIHVIWVRRVRLLVLPIQQCQPTDQVGHISKTHLNILEMYEINFDDAAMYYYKLL